MRAILKSLVAVALALAGALGGCNEYHYRYEPVQQPALAPMFADYREHEGILDILVDTHGRRLTAARLQTQEGSTVEPTGIDYPVFQRDLIGGMAGYKDPRYGADIAQGPTVVHFDLTAAGPGPWRVELDVLGVGRVSIVVGGR
jgi:hypothetical protein